MPTTTASPPVAAEVLALAGRFNVAASTHQFGIESLFGLWSQLRIAAARHTPDILAGSSFAAILDRVLDHRANPTGAAFNVLTVAAARRS
ncbi:MAG TPA: hypothetical protein VNI34_07435 [Candidatus Nitrosotalea sp.]|nr:hypothetical protein [Candidatus Nitrosotalea sp.]